MNTNLNIHFIAIQGVGYIFSFSLLVKRPWFPLVVRRPWFPLLAG
jgi:hypothetical protein